MSRVAVIGESLRVEGFALAGALVLAAETEADVCAAWRSLPADVAVAVLTPRAAAALGDTLAGQLSAPAAAPPGTPGAKRAGTRQPGSGRPPVSGAAGGTSPAPLWVVMPS